jgi:hypothetical protein
MFRVLLIGLVSIPALLHIWAALGQPDTGASAAPEKEWRETKVPEVALADAISRADTAARLLWTQSLDRIGDPPVPPEPDGKDREEKASLEKIARRQGKLLNDAKWAAALYRAVPNEKGAFEVEIEGLAQDAVFKDGNLLEEVRRVRDGARELGKARNVLALETKRIARKWLSDSAEKKMLVPDEPTETARKTAVELSDLLAGSKASRLRTDAEKVLREWKVLQGILERSGRTMTVPEQIDEIARVCGLTGLGPEDGRELLLGLLQKFLPPSLGLDPKVILINKNTSDEDPRERAVVEVRWKKDQPRTLLSGEWSKGPNEFDFLPGGRHANEAEYFDPGSKGGITYYTKIKPTPRSWAAKQYNEGRQRFPWTVAGLKELLASCRAHREALEKEETLYVWGRIDTLVKVAERHPELFR